jgi:hypothetical protein
MRLAFVRLAFVLLAAAVATTASASPVPEEAPLLSHRAGDLALEITDVRFHASRSDSDVEIFSPGAFLTALEFASYEGRLKNLNTTGGGPVPITEVVFDSALELTGSIFVRYLEAIVTSKGAQVVIDPCTGERRSGDEGGCGFTATIGDMAANETIDFSFTLQGVAPGEGVLNFTLSQAEFDPDPSNNTIEFPVVVTEAPTISGQKWLDLDGDGAQSDGELPVDGVPVQLLDATGAVVAETVTGPYDGDGDGAVDPLAERGVYRFGLPETPGTYTVAEPVPDGWAAVPAGGVHEVEVEDSAIDGLDFYNRPPPDLDLDFGDARDSYLTLWPAGPSNFVFPLGQIHLGVEIDDEDNGVPTLDASGDDLFLPALDQIDDEDGLVGISFGDGGRGQLTVRTSAAGVLDAWFDFDGDGTFVPPAFVPNDDHIVVAEPIPAAGEHTVLFDVPSGGRRAGPLRLRFHDVPGGLDVGGIAWNGEVEDHLVAGLASNTATGDDNDPDDNQNDGPRDDEDGVAFGEGFVPFTIQLPVGTPEPSAPNPLTRYGLVAGTTGTLTFFPNVDGGLDAWVDWNRDGDWDDDGEHVFSNERMGPSDPPPTLDLQAPPGASVGYTHARFRFSRNGALNATGVAPDGEVEDYLLAIFPPLDYGDAPAPYPSAAADGGARHGVDVIRLGAAVEAEVEPDADDADDGVTLPDELYRGADMAVTVTTAGDAPAALYAWIDWNADGDWDDDGEQAVGGEVLAAGSHIVTITPPADATSGTTWARFRVSRVALPFVAGAEVDPTLVPFVTEGEVEDYPVEIAANGVASEDGPAPSETAIESVAPNPARRSLAVRVALADAGEATVRLVDTLGREVLTAPLGSLPAGRHAVPLDVAALPAGVYVVVVDAGALRLTRSVVVVR